MPKHPALADEVHEELIRALSKDRVITAPDAVDGFKDPYDIPEDDTFTASAVVEPTVRLAFVA